MAARVIAAAAMARREKERMKTDEELLKELDEEQAAEDVYNPFIDPENYKEYPLLEKYVTFTNRIRDVVYGAYEGYFSTFIMFFIVLAGILVGIQTYDSMSENTVLAIIDWVILVVFAIECVLKMLAEGLGPWRYFYNGWNVFDFAIVVMVLPFFASLFGGGSVALLRLFRLARLIKIIKKVPQLYMIVMGLIGGLSSITYIVLLLFLVFYLYAVTGILAFRENDPFHFSSVPIALFSLFRASTIDGFSDIMYIDMFGCDSYYGSDYNTNLTDNSIPGLYDCAKGEGSPIISPIYWISFILISALVMMSLFVGAVTMSMTESMMNVKREEEEKRRKERLLEQRKQMEERANKMKALEEERQQKQQQKQQEQQQRKQLAKKSSSFSVDPSSQTVQPSSSSTLGTTNTDGSHYFEEDQEEDKEEEHAPIKKALSLKEREEIKAQRELNALLMQAWEGIDHVDSLHFDDLGYAEGCVGYYSRLAEMCKTITEHAVFVNFVTLVIVMAGVVVGLQTDEELVEQHKETLDQLDLFILIVFTIEVVLKLIAEETDPLNYFRSKWNVFDFIIVVGSFLPGGGSMLTMLRLLRLLRVLKLVKSLPQLAIIVNALIMGISSIGFIGLILFLCFYMFAILGMILFKDNDPFHFGTLHAAMITLMQCATFDDWTEVAYTNIYGCDVFGYDDAFMVPCDKPREGGVLAAFYFIAFIIIGSLVLFTLFIGVVTTSMDEATEKQKELQEMEDRVKAYQKENGLHNSTIILYKKAFSMLDLDGGGTIEEDELSFGLEAVGIEASTEEIQRLMARVDEDESGEIDLAEFVEFMTIVCRENRPEGQEEEGREEDREEDREEEDREEIELIEKPKLVSPRGSSQIQPEL